MCLEVVVMFRGRCKTVANFCSKVNNLVMCGSETFEYKIVREKKKIEKI
jgi:hypothetical protein